MSDVAVLVTVVVAIYILQCIIWAPARATVFRASFLRGRKKVSLGAPPRDSAKVIAKSGVVEKKAAKNARKQAGKSRAALRTPDTEPVFAPDGRRASRGFVWNAPGTSGFLANLLPVDALIVVNWPAASLDPAGLMMEAEPAPIPWEQLKLTRSGHKLKYGDTVILSGPEKQLRDFEKFAVEVGKASSNARAALIEKWLSAVTDVAAARERYSEFRSVARSAAAMVCLQFFVLFGVVPWLFYRVGTRAVWGCLALLLCVSVSIAIEFWQLHKQFYPQASDSRWTHGLTIVLSPLSAIRAMDLLTRDLLAGFHPVTAAAVVCVDEEFAGIAGGQLRELRYATISTAERSKWWNESLTRALQAVVAKRGLTADQLLAAPARQQDCDVYCPRCLAQYLAAREACSDCGYEGLMRF
jgi:hypothetical protein